MKLSKKEFKEIFCNFTSECKSDTVKNNAECRKEGICNCLKSAIEKAIDLDIIKKSALDEAREYTPHRKYLRTDYCGIATRLDIFYYYDNELETLKAKYEKAIKEIQGVKE